jgi:IMP dehydrogenase
MEIRGFLNDHMPCLNFEDVLIEPRVSNVFPEEADISTMMIAGIKSNLPIISAHMSSVSSPELIAAISEMGGLGTVHEEMTVDELDRYIAKTKQFRIDKSKYPNAVATESGTPVIIAACSSYDIEKAEYLLAHEDVNYVILNNVQPLHVHMIRNVKRLARKYPYKIIAGNIVTREGAQIYSKFPLAALKVGLGSGSICTTGIVSGCGMSQLTSIIEVSAIAKANGVKVIADGGIKNGGDIAKALAAGADGVMLGKLFAGCDEAPGKIVELDGKRYKQYEGSRYNTVEIPEQTGVEKIDRFLTAELKKAHRVEGVSGLVPLIGPAHLLLYILSRSIKLSFGFVGAKTIEELQKRAILRYVSANCHHELKSNMPFHTTEAYI